MLKNAIFFINSYLHNHAHLLFFNFFIWFRFFSIFILFFRFFFIRFWIAFYLFLHSLLLFTKKNFNTNSIKNPTFSSSLESDSSSSSPSLSDSFFISFFRLLLLLKFSSSELSRTFINIQNKHLLATYVIHF